MVNFIKLKNDFNTEVVLCDIGASIYDIRTIDINNEIKSIVYTTFEKKDFPYDGSYFGKTLGRTAGRIENREFVLNDRVYLVVSNDPNGLHGGQDSFSFARFDFIEFEDDESFGVTFSYHSKDGESGYPGNLDVKVIYRLFKAVNKLEITYKGISDQDTLLNMSNHTYFNLSGNAKTDILNHELFIASNKMERVENLIPKDIVSMQKVYSFANSHKIGDYLFDKEIISNTNGYDFPYLFDEVNLDKYQVILKEPHSKRTLKIKTSYPCAVVYTCNYVGEEIMNNGLKAKPYYAVCIECSYLPNSINNPLIKDKKDILLKGKEYNEIIELHFGVEK